MRLFHPLEVCWMVGDPDACVVLCGICFVTTLAHFGES